MDIDGGRLFNLQGVLEGAFDAAVFGGLAVDIGVGGFGPDGAVFVDVADEDLDGGLDFEAEGLELSGFSGLVREADAGEAPEFIGELEDLVFAVEEGFGSDLQGVQFAVFAEEFKGGALKRWDGGGGGPGV